jgi:hypothetical protein
LTYVYLYAVRIKHLTFDSECRVYFSVDKKNYAIYRDGNDLWLESEEGLKCKLLYFVMSDTLFTTFTEGECSFDGEWVMLNKWEKEG